MISVMPILKDARDSHVHVNTGKIYLTKKLIRKLLDLIEFEDLASYIGFNNYCYGYGECMKDTIYSMMVC